MRITTSAPATGAGPWRGLALVCLAGVIWGTIGPAVDVVDRRSTLSVWVVGGYRALAAVLVLLLAAALSGRLRLCVRLLSSHFARAVGIGALTAIFMILFFVAVVAIGVSVATVLALGWAPVLLQLIHAVRTRRWPPPGEVLTVVAAVLGLVLISVAGGSDPVAGRPVLGVMTALASGTAYALAADLVGPLHEHDGLTVATVTMTVAALVLVSVGAVAGGARPETLTTPDATTWLLVAYLGVVTMALAYVLLYAGLRSTHSRTAVVATLFEPVTAVAIAVLLLGERLSTLGALGALLIVAAIASLGLRPSVCSQPGRARAR